MIRCKLKVRKIWREKIVPNKGKIASRAIKAGAVYVLMGPTVALAINKTAFYKLADDIIEGYAGIAQSCLGGKKLGGFIPIPKSYLEGSLCVALILACGAAAFQDFGNGLTNVACASLAKNLANQNPA